MVYLGTGDKRGTFAGLYALEEVILLSIPAYDAVVFGECGKWGIRVNPVQCGT